MSDMQNLLSKMYGKNSKFKDLVDEFLIEGGDTQGGDKQRTCTTTASTAHPDMVAVHFTVLCDYAVRNCPPRCATKRYQYVYKKQDHHK